jgi:hypothetical protein
MQHRLSRLQESGKMKSDNAVSAQIRSLMIVASIVTGCAYEPDVEGDEQAQVELDEGAQALTVATQRFSMADAYYGSSTFGGCSSGSKKDIVGSEPVDPGTYPVFVYITGTTMAFNGAEARIVTDEMAKRGFVAGTVEYANGSYPSCGSMKTKASCIFDRNSSNSAISKLCARAKADCSQGIVVSGFSQGANLAALSKNYDSRVRGAYLIGHGNKASIIDVSSCANNSATVLAPNEMRSINGDADQYFGKTADGVRNQLQAVVGVSCPGSYNCLKADGSGWFMVAGSSVADRKADHCYFFNGANSSCSSYSGLESSWTSGTSAASVSSNLNWLASKVGH